MSTKNNTPVGVIDVDKCKNVEVVVDTSSNRKMSLYEFARWNCLAEAVAIIGEKCDTLSSKVGRPVNWIKPIPIQKYIDERTMSMLFEIVTERNITEVFKPCTTS
mgnify:FL=1|tara:strand:- start:311 stop:625 length:315 start_codon:yes stop_codon:yes gene_type:complete